MLILQRRPGESLRIGDDIEITVVAVEGGRARLAITAPADVTILRSELIQAKEANRESAIEQTVSAELFSMLEESLPAGKAVPHKSVHLSHDLQPKGKEDAKPSEAERREP